MKNTHSTSCVIAGFIGVGVPYDGNAFVPPAQLSPQDSGLTEVANSPDFFKNMGQQFVGAAVKAGAAAPQFIPKKVAYYPVNKRAKAVFDFKNRATAANEMVWAVAA